MDVCMKDSLQHVPLVNSRLGDIGHKVVLMDIRLRRCDVNTRVILLDVCL